MLLRPGIKPNSWPINSIWISFKASCKNGRRRISRPLTNKQTRPVPGFSFYHLYQCIQETPGKLRRLQPLNIPMDRPGEIHYSNLFPISDEINQSPHPTSFRYSLIIKAAVAPSPAAEAACFVEPARTSPAANKPG